MHVFGLGGLEKNETKAWKLFEQAAAKDISRVQCTLTRMYFWQGGIELNETRARKLLEKAASQSGVLAAWAQGILDRGKAERKAKEETIAQDYLNSR